MSLPNPAQPFKAYSSIGGAASRPGQQGPLSAPRFMPGNKPIVQPTGDQHGLAQVQQKAQTVAPPTNLANNYLTPQLPPNYQRPSLAPYRTVTASDKSFERMTELLRSLTYQPVPSIIKQALGL